MKLQIHFGSGTFCVDVDDDDDDADFLVPQMVRLVQLVLPHLFVKVFLSREGADLPHVVAQAIDEPLARRHSLHNALMRTPSRTNASTTAASDVQYHVMLQAQTKTFGPLLIINRKQWNLTREVVLREEKERQQQQQESPPLAQHDAVGEAVMSLEVVMLQYKADSGFLHVCKYDELAAGSSPVSSACHEHSATHVVGVTDTRGNTLGEVRLEPERPPLRCKLEEALQKMLPAPLRPLRMAYRVYGQRELLPLESDADVAGLVRDVQQFSCKNILIVAALPSRSCATPTGAADVRASVDVKAAVSKAPPPQVLSEEESAKAQHKNEETRQMVAAYARLMQALRHGVPATPRGEQATTRATPPSPSRKKSISRSGSGGAVGEGAACDSSGGAYLRVRYELDPVEVHVTGPITESELQRLADAIVARCVRHNDDDDSGGSNNSSKATAGKEPRFERVASSMYTFCLRDCDAFDDAQVAALEECLVDVVTSFGCRRVEENGPLPCV
ncbi:hypothetical protein DQ04_02151080 [Trypanosoma grayi]|uniref:hypothetical protein n=1 Tax=Trypanosoma grayi TaxID=71804 RepID=UPI0004F4A8D3|nr:hypothetical protein DQ04_02151080 [Trypanosoma grayi]KEG11919.1 hypothetical protein DQ04_02151080 [Trypanosoma grayi]